MAKDLDFINKEKDTWGKVFTDITYAINEVSPFLESSTLKKRRYYNKIGTLKEYVSKLNSLESEANKKSLFNAFKSSDRISTLESFKNQNRDCFVQLENCSKCQCLNCSFECKFASCSSCKQGSLLKSCDREHFNVRSYTCFNIDLTNNDNGQTSKYKVLATIENCRNEKLYILLENLYNTSEKLILYFYPGIKEDSYGEITDEVEFNSVVQAYQEANI